MLQLEVLYCPEYAPITCHHPFPIFYHPMVRMYHTLPSKHPWALAIGRPKNEGGHLHKQAIIHEP